MAREKMGDKNFERFNSELNRASKKKNKRQGPKPSGAVGAATPDEFPFDSPSAEEPKTVTPDVAGADSAALSSNETGGAKSAQLNMNEVLEQDNHSQRNAEKENAEAQAEKELRIRLERVFPKEGEGGSTVSQSVLIDEFLKTHPGSHKFLMYERYEHLAGEIFTFFNGGDFVNLLDLKNTKEKSDAKKLARKYIMDRGVGLWKNSNSARKTAHAGTEKLLDDLEAIRVEVETPNKVSVDGTSAEGGVVKDADLKNIEDSNLSNEENGVLKESGEKEVQGEESIDRQALLGDVPDMKMDLSGDSMEKLSEDEAEFSLRGDVPDLERFEGKETVANKDEGTETVIESLLDLQERVNQLKNKADAARNRLFSYRKRTSGRWEALKRYFISLQKKDVPQPLVDEQKDLEADWNYKLTLYKDARVELAKRKVSEEGLQGKEVGAVMAETIRELDLRGVVENYNAWKDAAWNGDKDSWFLRSIGRAKDWGESYRKLDWKKRAAISAVVMSVGISGVAVGSVGLVGLGAASGAIVRLLGSYAAGRGLYEYLEGRANKETAEFHEAALSNVEQSDNLSFLERRTRDYADRTQKDFERMTKKNRKRVWASAAAGALLFAGGTAFSLAHAASAAERIADGGSSVQAIAAESVKIPVETPVAPLDDATEKMLAAAKRVVIENRVTGIPAPGVAEVGVNAPSVAAEATASGASGQVLENVWNAGKGLAEMTTLPKGGSFEGVLIEKLMGDGVSNEEAGKLAHLAMLDLAEKSGKPFALLNHVQPGAEIQYEIGPDHSLHVLGVTRKAGGEFIQRITESVSGETSPSASVIRESIVPRSDTLDVSSASPSLEDPSHASFPEMPRVNLESPQDILDRTLPPEPTSVQESRDIISNLPNHPPQTPIPVENSPTSVETVVPVSSPAETVISVDQAESPSKLEPLDTFDKYKNKRAAAIVGASAAALGAAGLIGSEVAEMRARRKAREQAEEEKNGREFQDKAREVFLRVASLTQIPEDRRYVLQMLSENYGRYGKRRPSDEIFEATQRKIATVLFGSEDIPDDVLDNMFLAVAQGGIGDPENKKSAEIRTGIKNGYSVFQVLFGRTGERLPAGKITGLSVRDVLRLFTERFLTGRMPEELRGSGV